jgi:hypothetical protein
MRGGGAPTPSRLDTHTLCKTRRPLPTKVHGLVEVVVQGLMEVRGLD